MKAVFFDAPHRMRVGPLERAAPGPGEVWVKVIAVGICAGDQYIYLGKNPYVRYPAVGGHEIVGVVAEVGEGVALKVGTRVVVEPFIGCGRCYACGQGKSNCCRRLEIIGVHRPGGFAQEVLAPGSHVHPIPDALSSLRASFTEPIAIAVQALKRGAVQSGEELLLLGCGPIGLAVIEVARAYGVKVLATDLSPERLEQARTFGAEVLPPGDALLPAVLERTGGDGVGVVLEATGSARVMEQTVELVAAGGRIVLVGLVGQGVGVTFPGLDFTRKELSVLGSRASVGCFPEALRLLSSGVIHYPEVATELSLWDAPQTFARMETHPGEIHKGVFTLE